MSIVVNIIYSGKGNNARNFAEEMENSGIANQIRSVPGNIQYEYFFPLRSLDTVLLIDKWNSQEVLDQHHESTMMQTIAALREKYDLHMTVKRYIEDKEYKLAQDSRYIRE